MTAPAAKPRADTLFDILGIGNAIVDVVAPVHEAFLRRHDMRKGGMALIDAATAERLYADMPAGQESSGGSAANTCAVAAGAGRARGLSRQGRRRPARRACSATTSPPPACISRPRRWPAAPRPRAA